MKTICLYFQVHQPFRFRRYRFFDIGNDHYYYDDYTNEAILRKIANNCYLPANQLFLDLINKNKGKFKIAFSISGIAIDQFKLYAPEVLESFRRLADTGHVEFLAETYSHSLVSLKDKKEFENQVNQHKIAIEELFGVTPTSFRNTELIYSDQMGEMVANMGFKGMITEGAKHILGWKSPNFLYCNAINPRLKMLLKNFKLSDDIAFRFSNRNWSEWPLTAEKYVGWLKSLDNKEEVINLFLNYETFGEIQSSETGIFEFIKKIPEVALKNSFRFATPTEVTQILQPVAAINVPYPISWADEERDLTAWLGNEMQQEAFNKLYELLPLVEKCTNPILLKDWSYLQASDHFYYMSTKFFSDGDIHTYFTPYDTPYEAFINYMNVLSDFSIRLNEEVPQNSFNEEVDKLYHLLKQKEDMIQNLESQLKAKSSKNGKKEVIDDVATKEIKPKATTEKKKASAKKVAESVTVE